MRKINYGIVGIIISLLAFLVGCTATMKADRLLEQKNYTGAIELYKQNAIKNPGDFNARSKLGFAYFKAGMLDNAVDEFNSTLKMEPGDPFSTLYLGATYLKRKQLPQAIAIWERYKDSERPEVEKEIGRQVALLLAASRATGSSESTTQKIVRQMDSSVEKAEAAWYDAEMSAINQAFGGGGGNGGGGGGGGG